MNENVTAQEGQSRCHYCGKVIDKDKKVRGVVISRQYPGMRATFDYCSKECERCDQMAHEG